MTFLKSCSKLGVHTNLIKESEMRESRHMNRRYLIDQLMLAGMGGVYDPDVQGRVHIDEGGNRVSANGKNVRQTTTEELQIIYMIHLETKNKGMNARILQLEAEIRGRKKALLIEGTQRVNYRQRA